MTTLKWPFSLSASTIKLGEAEIEGEASLTFDFTTRIEIFPINTQNAPKSKLFLTPR
jgi:hypothetical protein